MDVKQGPYWWRHAVVYQIYPRSFADGNGDGIGDLIGARERLPYLASLGVDAVWFSPWYPSPWADGGYDVADYRGIDPLYGTLDDARSFIDLAHELGVRVLLDLVPNHTSVEHPLFRRAQAAGPGNPHRQLFHFRDGRGENGALPPNNWRSNFGGPAWTRITEPDGTPGQWYLHMFAPGQPDWNWDHPAVHAEFETTLRFWFDLGVDGFRIDVADYLYKQPGLPDYDYDAEPAPAHPWHDQPGTYEIYRSWRRIADSYDEPKVLIGELWKEEAEQLLSYIGTDRLDSGFNFTMLTAPYAYDRVRAGIETALTAHRTTTLPSPWVLSNHDVVRPATRYGTAGTDCWKPPAPEQVDPELGLRRARAMALLSLALPGNAAIYQGEELGLPEVLDIPEDRLRDPIWEQSGHTNRGRDGCRVPLPWQGSEPTFGFSPGTGTGSASGEPWLPQPAAWKDLTAETQDGDPHSTLRLYQEALRLRKERGPFTDPDLAWLPTAPGMLAFRRGDGEQAMIVAVNFSDAELPLPDHARVLLASGPMAAAGMLPADTAVWLVEGVA